MPNTKQPEEWHLDKKVPIAIIGTILVQTFFIGYGAATLNSRVSALELNDQRTEVYINGRVKLNEERWEILNKERGVLGERLSKVETAVGFILDGVKRIENKLDRDPAK